MMFAVITPALMTGAFVDRFRFGAYLFFIAFWTILVYLPAAHWVWGDVEIVHRARPSQSAWRVGGLIAQEPLEPGTALLMGSDGPGLLQRIGAGRGREQGLKLHRLLGGELVAGLDGLKIADGALALGNEPVEGRSIRAHLADDLGLDLERVLTPGDPSARPCSGHRAGLPEGIRSG